MEQTEQQVAAPAFKDRSTGLVLFGVLEILIGAGFILLSVIALISISLGRSSGGYGGQPPPPGQIAAVAAVYVAMAAWSVALGIGSIGKKRWARALSLITAWYWVIVATVVAISSVFTLPGTIDMISADAQVDSAAFAVFLFGFMGLLLLVVYGVNIALILFYRSRNVKATCESHNPHISWTDRCPLPVLALSMLSAYGGVALLCLPLLYNPVFPIPGGFIEGWSAGLIFLALAAVQVWLVWGLYRLRMAAWWTYLAFYVSGMAIYFVSLPTLDITELYTRMGFAPDQSHLMLESGALSLSALFWTPLISCLCLVSYLLYVRKYFVAAKEQASVMPGASPEEG